MTTWVRDERATASLTLYPMINVKPEIPLTPIIRAPRTATTVTLIKPICVFTNGNIVDVFGVQAAMNTNPNDIGNGSISTYQQTNGGKTGPYRAASFDIPTCTSLAFEASTVPAEIQAEIDKYLFRVGNDVQCLNQVNNLIENCNAPLNADVQYRFKYAVRNTSTNRIVDETLWSDSISLLKAPEPTDLDTWPGRRTGGMVVITTLLVILLFLILCAFVALLMYVLCLKEETLVVDQQPAPRTYFSHQKNRGFSESTYSEATKAVSQQPSEPERYQTILEGPPQTPVAGD
ncbi:uroplakin-3a-like isoform X2 [Heptranchias perlo]|uniref:uroplakin-3a-like isoform X2 n=1 Tax=Heptranchias perlo TaxID=212740 RepID=UPI0035595DD2